MPRPALREAILNAIVHRDYTTGIPIQIKVFPDSVIVYNDGRLPENWTVSDLLARHRSYPYNPKIAYAFYRSGYIETWGRGIERITEACEYARKPKPLFEASPGEIKVTFFTDIDTTVNGKPDNNTNDTVKDTINDTQRRILKLFTANAKTTVQAISAELGINERNVKKNIKALKDAGLVKRVGAAKSGHWIVIQPKIDRADKPATTVIRRKK